MVADNLASKAPRVRPNHDVVRQSSQVAVEPAFDIDAALRASGDTTENLFKLANRPAVRLSVGGGFVEVAQDRSTTEHSGGVVWETSFFLVRYLERHILPGMQAPSAGRKLRVVELGSGCGLLGLALARLGCDVVLTDQPSALANLRANARTFVASSTSGKPSGTVKVMPLDWAKEEDITAARKHGPFDLVVASDVVFASRLVEPLLRTIAGLLEDASGMDAACWLCLQQRDPDAHELLLRMAPNYLSVHERSFVGLKGFEAAVELECLVLELRPRSPTAAHSPEVTSAAVTNSCGADASHVRVGGRSRVKKRRRSAEPAVDG